MFFISFLFGLLSERLKAGGQIVQRYVIKHKVVDLALTLRLNNAADGLRLSLGAHQHQPALGRDLTQPCAQGQAEVDVVCPVLGYLQQRPGGQMGTDGHVGVGIVRLIAQLDARPAPTTPAA